MKRLNLYGLALSSVALSLVGCVSLSSMKAPQVVLAESQMSTRAKLDKSIEFNKARVERDPQGAIGLAMLSESYLAKARAFDDDEAAQHAEVAARESLTMRTTNNARAARRLTEALLAQHRFADAKESATLAVQVSGNDPQCLRQLGDVLLELGDYTEFKKLVAEHPDLSDSPEGLAMMGRWYEVTGKPELSVSLLNQAVERVKESGKGHESVLSWYQTQLGWTLLRMGERNQAEKTFESALDVNAQERKSIAGLARIAYLKGDWTNVVKLSKEANAIAPLTDVMGWEAIALDKLNRPEEANRLIAEIQKVNHLTEEEAAGKVHAHGTAAVDVNSRHTHSRLYSMFLADAGRHLEFAHHAAEEDLQWRKDIHAYDAFAWATYRFWLLDPVAQIEGDGLLAEAKVAIKKAMSLGTKDVTVLEHAKEILAASPRK
jgi:tetratricopeptide (TPR) repeat protein